MKQEKVELSFMRANLNELDVQEKELINKAKHSLSNAYNW